MKKNKLLTGILAGVCATAMLVVGTLAVQGSDNKVNQFFGGKPTDPPSVIITETGYADGQLGAKPVRVKNTGGEDVYIRVQLSELLKIGATAPKNKAEAVGVTGWELHKPTGGSVTDSVHSGGANTDFHKDFDWTFGPDVVHAQSFIAGTFGAGKWIYEGTDGYAYWSDPLTPGEETTVFLSSVEMVPGSDLEEEDYYYAVDVFLQWVTREDLPLWYDATATPAEPGDTSAGGVSGSQKIKDHLRAVANANPIDTVAKYNTTVTGLKAAYNIGETVGPLTVAVTLKDGGAAVPVTNFTIVPTTIAADTKQVVVNINLSGGGTVTYKQTITVNGVTPITPDNADYTYRVRSTKGDYKAGDAVVAGDIVIEYQKNGTTGWTTDTTASFKSAAPATLAEGVNNVAVTFTVDGKDHSRSFSVTAAAATPEQPADVIGPMSNTSYYKQVTGENPHLYEVVEQNGTGTGVFIYDVNDEIPNNDDEADVATFLPVVKYTGGIRIKETATDPEMIIGTVYFHKHTNSTHVPIYPGGANYMQVFHWGSDSVLGGDNEVGANILSGQRKIPASQQDNWQTR